MHAGMHVGGDLYTVLNGVHWSTLAVARDREWRSYLAFMEPLNAGHYLITDDNGSPLPPSISSGDGVPW